MSRPDEVVDQLTTKLALLNVGWDKKRWDRFVNELTADEQQLELQMLKDASAPGAFDLGATLLVVLQDALIVAGAVTGIATAITSVKAVFS